MTIRTRVFLSVIAAVTGVLLATAGCVYYNTFFNARQSFDDAEKLRRKTGQISQSQYQKAIDKSLKVVEYHANSKYYDDALYVLGVSYYYTKQYPKAERRFREIIANYPNSEFIKESNLYLAKTKLAMKDDAEAMSLFGELFKADYSKAIKAEAALALGDYHFELKEYDQSHNYYMAVRDSLGDAEQRKIAEDNIAEGFFRSYKFQDALKAYLQILGMNPARDDKYHALYSAAICSYRLQRVQPGIDYLNQLIKDPLYFDSLGVLQLTVAQGYEYAGDLAQAEFTYNDVATHTQNKQWEGEAYYRIGLIYQFDYDDLPTAKRYYDKAVQANGGAGDNGRDALQRSTDIAKLDTFYSAASKLDTNATQDKINAVARTQYQLAQLYWFQLNKPDSAINEMEYVARNYPTAAIVPQSMISLSGMYMDYLNDTAKADSVLKELIKQYPHCDEMPQVLGLLGLRNTPADTGYAEWYIHKAENLLLDDKQVDSARYYYQYVVDSFPDSKYNTQARFNLIWIRDNYDMPGDSSVLLAYKQFIDSFPNSPLAAEAQKRLPRVGGLKREKRQQSDTTGGVLAGEPGQVRKDSGQLVMRSATADTSKGYVDPLQAVYVGPNGEQLILLDITPRETLVEFEYPPQAYGLQDRQIYLYFQILLDFSGKVLDYNLKIPSQNDEINRRAGATVASMTFDPLDVSKELSSKAGGMDIPEQKGTNQGRWYVFKFLVKKPDYIQ